MPALKSPAALYIPRKVTEHGSLAAFDPVSEDWTEYVTVSAKTVLIGTFSITRKTDLKPYSSCCGSVVLEFSHTSFTI